LYPEQFRTMMNEIEQIAPIVGRNLARGVNASAVAASGQ
jgi:hypothetical protein